MTAKPKQHHNRREIDAPSQRSTLDAVQFESMCPITLQPFHHKHHDDTQHHRDIEMPIAEPRYAEQRLVKQSTNVLPRLSHALRAENNQADDDQNKRQEHPSEILQYRQA